jgi:GT2 family glycosyltransferase
MSKDSMAKKQKDVGGVCSALSDIDRSVSVLTVTLNAEEFVDGYFTSLFRGEVSPTEVLIYDGGSRDRTIELVNKYQREYPQVRLFKGENIGFAAANNLLASKAMGKFLFVLNPDTKLDRRCLVLLSNDERREQAIIAPRQVLFDGTLIGCGSPLDVVGYSGASIVSCPGSSNVFYADGASIFLPKAVFVGLGMFDPEYFMFHEDVDLCWRSHLQRVPVVTNCDAVVYHYGGGTESGGVVKGRDYATTHLRRYLGERNAIQSLLKNYSTITLMWIAPCAIIMNVTEAFMFLVLLKPKVAFGYVRCYGWILREAPRIWKKRREVQSRRMASDFEIMKRMYFGSFKLRVLAKVGIPRFK